MKKDSAVTKFNYSIPEIYAQMYRDDDYKNLRDVLHKYPNLFNYKTVGMEVESDRGIALKLQIFAVFYR